MKEIWEEIKKSSKLIFFCVILGILIGRNYTQNSISIDCKVLGMFRIGTYGYGCQASRVPA